MVYFFLQKYQIIKKPNETEVKKTNLKRKRNEDENDQDPEMNENKKQFLSLKQAKFDVFKFGIKGFSKEEQESAKIKLAIKLGAAVSFLILIKNAFNS